MRLDPPKPPDSGLVRIQVDIPADMNEKLEQLKLLEGFPKRHVIKRGIEELFKLGKQAI